MPARNFIEPGRPRYKLPSLVKRLRRLLHGRVEHAYLIGSYARNEATRDSDIDLLVVCETRKPFVERPSAFLDVALALGATDLVVYTPAEWRELMREPTPFIRHAMKTCVEVI